MGENDASTSTDLISLVNVQSNPVPRVINPVPLRGFNPDDNSVYDPLAERRRFKRKGPKVEVQAYTVQCALCLSWRIVPTEEHYEAIRQRILERPWVCENARSWRPDASCAEPPDLQQDNEAIWAMDKPNLPSTPPGWKRDLVIRSRGSTKFADVYYTSPCGRRLRSMVEIRKFLQEHPDYLCSRISLDQFCFTTPQPVERDYVRKRIPGTPTLKALAGNTMKALPGNEGEALSWNTTNIPPTPSRWKREVVMRSKGSSKVSDVYYTSPCGRKLRSLVEVCDFLNEKPAYVFEGVSLDQFSFTAPLSGDDVRRTASLPGNTVRTTMRGRIRNKSQNETKQRDQPAQISYKQPAFLHGPDHRLHPAVLDLNRNADSDERIENVIPGRKERVASTDFGLVSDWA